MTTWLTTLWRLTATGLLDRRQAHIIGACAVLGRAPDFRVCPWCGVEGHGTGGACLNREST